MICACISVIRKICNISTYEQLMWLKWVQLWLLFPLCTLHVLQEWFYQLWIRILFQMHMTYWFGVDLGSFLFSGYNITTVWGLLATCMGLAALALLYEVMKVSQFHLQQFNIKSMPRTISDSSESLSLLSKVTSRTFRISSHTQWYLISCFKTSCINKLYCA